MKFINLLPFTALSVAFVIPDEKVMSQVAINTHEAPETAFDKLPSKDQAITEFENTFSKLVDNSKTAFDQVLDSAANSGESAVDKAYGTAFDAKAWLESAADKVEDLGKHGKHGHHGHGKPNMTVCISKFSFDAESRALTSTLQ